MLVSSPGSRVHGSLVYPPFIQACCSQASPTQSAGCTGLARLTSFRPFHLLPTVCSAPGCPLNLRDIPSLTGRATSASALLSAWPTVGGRYLKGPKRQLQEPLKLPLTGRLGAVGESQCSGVPTVTHSHCWEVHSRSKTGWGVFKQERR